MQVLSQLSYSPELKNQKSQFQTSKQFPNPKFQNPKIWDLGFYLPAAGRDLFGILMFEVAIFVPIIILYIPCNVKIDFRRDYVKIIQCISVCMFLYQVI